MLTESYGSCGFTVSNGMLGNATVRGRSRYDIRHPGYKYNLTDLQAALGLAQLERLDDLNGRRAQLVARYREGLTGVAGLDLPQVPPYPHVHSWHLFVVKVLSLKREHFLEQLAAYNIGYGLHFPAAHELSYLKGRTETGTSILTADGARGGTGSSPFPFIRR